MNMKLYTNHLQFLFILFLPYFVSTISTIARITEGNYKGFKTLWKPYSRWYFSEISRRNQSEITNRIISTSPLFSRTTSVAIAWDYKMLFKNDDDDYDDLPPRIVQLIKRKMLNKGVTKQFQTVREHDWRRWQFERSEHEFPEELPPVDPVPDIPIPQAKPLSKPTPKYPTAWETPDPQKTILWEWTTTPKTSTDNEGDNYYNPNYGFYDDFYAYLRRRSTKVGGKTEHDKPLPTEFPIVGTTYIWRFWSFNPQSRQIETYLALEMEKQPTTAPQTTTTTVRSKKVRVNASCYVCGLDLPGIPRTPSCHHVFENADRRLMYLRKSYKRRCSPGKKGQAPKGKHWYGQVYRNGCFKRFTDIGIEYNERGCRTMEPTMGKSYASKRFARLEKTLYDVDDGCVVSPFASLTPFSRAISLYVRYHVCVCTGKYCNQAPRTLSHTLSVMKYISFIFILLTLK